MYFEIKVGSITNAQRAMRVLKMNNFKPTLKRLENPTVSDGCGYKIGVSSIDKDALKVLKNAGITILGVDEL